MCVLALCKTLTIPSLIISPLMTHLLFTKTEQNGKEELSLNLLINEIVGHTTTLKYGE